MAEDGKYSLVRNLGLRKPLERYIPSEEFGFGSKFFARFGQTTHLLIDVHPAGKYRADFSLEILPCATR